MITNKTYNTPQDIDINTVTEVIDLFTDFCFRFDPHELEQRFLKFFGQDLGEHFHRKMAALGTLGLYNSMTLGNRKKFVRLILADRYEANKDYLTALPLDYRPEPRFNSIFAPFESLQQAVLMVHEKDAILGGQLAETLTQLTAIAHRREGAQS